VILAALGRQADCPAYDDLRWELLVEHDLTDHAALRRLEIMRPEATRRRVREILRTRRLELPPDLRQVLQSLLDD
jgi:hypothetical protein